MKKPFALVLAVTAVTLAAGTDLPIDGKFRRIANGLPENWLISQPSAAKIIGGGEFFSKVLQLTAADTGVTATTRRSFPVSVTDKVEVEAEIKGRGTAFLAVELLDATGKSIGIQRIVTATATPHFRDIKGSLRLRDYTYSASAPVKIRIICGVEPGSEIVFDGVDAELDRD